MAYLPGVPDVGPAPVSPPGGGKTIAVQHLGSVVGRTGKGLTTVGGGDPIAHSLSHYGKPGKNAIRGGKMGSHVKKGGLGPGAQGMPGPDTNTNITQDTE